MDLEQALEPRHPGEYELKWALREHGFKVKDVSLEPSYQKKDIDLIATNIFTEEETTIEVKWDWNIAKTDNLFIELENPRSWGNEGWYKFIEADYVAYGDAHNGIFYFVSVAELRNCIDKVKTELRYHTTYDGSYGYLLPLRKLAEHAAVFTYILEKKGE